MHWKESLSLECKNVAGVTLKATKNNPPSCSSFLGHPICRSGELIGK